GERAAERVAEQDRGFADVCLEEVTLRGVGVVDGEAAGGARAEAVSGLRGQQDLAEAAAQQREHAGVAAAAGAEAVEDHQRRAVALAADLVVVELALRGRVEAALDADGDEA